MTAANPAQRLAHIGPSQTLGRHSTSQPLSVSSHIAWLESESKHFPLCRFFAPFSTPICLFSIPCSHFFAKTGGYRGWQRSSPTVHASLNRSPQAPAIIFNYLHAVCLVQEAGSLQRAAATLPTIAPRSRFISDTVARTSSSMDSRLLSLSIVNFRCCETLLTANSVLGAA
jgi:hypothetical protein